MTKKKVDPKTAALLDRQNELLEQYERQFSRVKRAWNRLVSVKRKLTYVARNIRKAKEETNGNDNLA
jgi:hypothetical protein